MGMRSARRGWLIGVVTSGLVAGGVVAGLPATAAQPLVPLSPSLVQALTATTTGELPVMVHGATLADAERAVQATGMRKVSAFDKIGVVVAKATEAQVDAARSQPGVTYLEGDQPLVPTSTSAVPGAGTPPVINSTTSHQATGSLDARNNLIGANGEPLDGTGVTIAVIDSGIDPTHPAFGGGKVVQSFKSLCVDESSIDTGCLQPVPTFVDTDTLALGGHGTHVASIAAGKALKLSDGTPVSGAAPGAKLVSLSTGAALVIIGSDTSMNWVLEHHAKPCGDKVPASVCPPIKVINNSYGPVGGGPFDPNSASVKLQRQLAAEGVVTVWAAGNDGGDGSTSLTNPPGQDPTGGILSVASYNDEGTGTRNGPVSEFSSRGAAGDPSTWPDISAPGENIVGACRLYLPICATGLQPESGSGLLDVGAYNTLSGTSMAAPHIAGIVAQLFQADPDATPAQIEDALKSTASHYANGAPYQNVGGYQTSLDKGTGLVNADTAALELGARTR
jgi:serine protease AprX